MCSSDERGELTLHALILKCVCVCVCVLQVDRLRGRALHGRPGLGLQHPGTAVWHLWLRQASDADNPGLPVQHRRQPANGVGHRGKFTSDALLFTVISFMAALSFRQQKVSLGEYVLKVGRTGW